MRRSLVYIAVVLILSFTGIAIWSASRVRATSVPAGGARRSGWSPKAAASYLDSREVWWQSWPAAQLGEGTVCISCHTVLPYALARPALRRQLGQPEMTATEVKMVDSIEIRVSKWQQIGPYYSDPAHAAPSRATESVLNAVILAEYDPELNNLGPFTRRAFDEAWALQETKGESAGGWAWQDFHEAPWEASESSYQGAAMMAVALGLTPAQYVGEPDVQDHVKHLRQYLHRFYAAQPVFNQLYVMWASAHFPELLTEAEQTSLINQVAKLQNPDGGWSLSALDRQTSLKHVVLDLFKRVDRVDGSDGCATGLVVLALEEEGVSIQNPMLQRGLTWLEEHQYEDGSWWAASMNGFRDPASGMGHFMSDAATAYATLALERDRSRRFGSAATTVSQSVPTLPSLYRSPM